MKKIKYFVFGIILFLVNINLIFAKDDVINRIDVNITLDTYGNAHIEEIWNVTANMGTEFYKAMYNLGNMEITNFKVYENNKEFTYINNWDINASLNEKAYKNGINYADEGIELCFGKGSMGNHIFKLTYDISNFVFTTNDSDIIYYQVINMGMTPPPKGFSLVLTGPNIFSDTLDVWGYGYKGYAYVNNGKIFMSNEENTQLSDEDYAVLLVKFPKGSFLVNENNYYEEFSNFEDIYNQAEEGTFSYNYSNSLDKIFSIIVVIFSLLFPVLIIIIAVLASNKYKFESLGKKINMKEINNFRDIPCNKDIFNAYFLSCVYDLNKKDTDFFGAVLLKWLLEDKIEIQKDKKENNIIVKQNLTFDNDVEKKLYEYLIDASKDYILEKKELEKWSRKNYNKLFNWINDAEKQGRVNYINKGLVEKKGSKFLIKDSLKEEAIHLAGLKKFLNEFSRIKEKKVIEVKLWKEYLIFAQIFGIAKEVAKQFKDYYPEILQYNDGYNSNFDIMDVIILNNITMSTVNAATSARSAANNYSSGGGGFSSGGGGFSSFGGGGGGGR